MAVACQCSAVCAATMVALVLAAAIATLTSVITAQEPPTAGSNYYRRCVLGDRRVCHFTFEVHPYQTMSRACFNCPRNISDCSLPDCVPGDGVRRRIIAINKQMPGPAIQVCEGDKIVVDVKNLLPDGGLTVHWHGLTMLGGLHDGIQYPSTPHMDGTPGITQCPIHSGGSFRYTFYALNPGTHWYHAHTGFHRADGVLGAIVIRQPPGKDHATGLYDYDLPQHTMVIHDWLHVPTEDKFVLRHHGGGDDFPESMLINGLGPHQNIAATPTSAAMPYQRFKVSPGARYRFRIINTGILNCPITVHIDEHHLTIIATDGNPVVPTNASSVVVYSGERWDVIVKTENTKFGTFWMSFMGGVDCAPTSAHQFALFEYEQVGQFYKTPAYVKQQVGQQEIPDSVLLRHMPPKPMYSEAPPAGVQVNSINSACYDDLICAAGLRSPVPMPEVLRTPRANYTFYLAFEMRQIHNAHFYSRAFYNFESVDEDQQIPTPQVNNLSFVGPSTPLLLSGGRYDTRVCSIENPIPGRSCHDDYCECLHMYHVPLGATVELVFIDEGQHGDENHPIHLHGHHFWVVGMDRPNDVVGAAITRDEVIELDRTGQLLRNFYHPVRKDTVTIPDGGYTVVRFIADNPGYWLMHCHLIFHSAAGMEVVFKVGELTDVPPPPAGFPFCGNFKSLDL
ncbi:laccase-2-like [Penaeus monodon]|uniref:laccase-2-like n=1 Tax=Penaeus monodon TaxID=6687 RepID=UPI0018A76828|nr:laccase-2-like [Penaeus monodon]